MKYRLYDCTVRWKTLNWAIGELNQTDFVRIATGDQEARECEDIDDQVFYWSEHEPNVGDDLGDCVVEQVTLGMTKYEVTFSPYGERKTVMAFTEAEARQLVRPTFAGGRPIRVEELGDA